MQICLITAPTIFDYDDPKVTLRAHRPIGTQLGILCLAATLEQHGYHSSIIDFDAMAAGLLRSSGQQVTSDIVFDSAVDALAQNDAEVFGFSSICSSYPLTLRLAREVKRLHPKAYVVLGGPQATAVDRETLEAFPWVDVVVRGEGDYTFPRLVDKLVEQRSFTGVEEPLGITFRQNGTVVRTPDSALITDLDSLPLPAYQMDPLITRRQAVQLEGGRGCPYHCTFCSTNRFFRHASRFKSTNTILRQMKELHERYGITDFSLVHDTFTLDRERVVEFADALQGSGGAYRWSCSARTDTVDEELLGLMARSGCHGIFFGVETGSSKLQQRINKKLDLGKAGEAIRSATGHGIQTTVALIAGFPEEERGDLSDTVHFFVNATRSEHVVPQLTLLAPLAGTPIEKRYRDRLRFDHIYSDMSQSGWREDRTDLEFIEKFPRVFPNFYSVPTLLPRPYIAEVTYFLDGMAIWFRWLPIALLDASGDLLAVFDEWTRWSDARVHHSPGTPSARDPRYYHGKVFVRDFLAFVMEALKLELPHAKSLRNILEYESALSVLEPGSQSQAPRDRKQKVSVKDQVRRAEGVTLLCFEFDVSQLLDSLRTGRDGFEIEDHKSWIAAVAHEGEPIQVLQLAEETARLLQLCEDKNTIEQVIDKYCESHSQAGDCGILKPAAMACLANLYERGVLALEVADAPLRESDDTQRQRAA